MLIETNSTRLTIRSNSSGVGRSYASLRLSGVKRNETKEKPFLSAEVSRYHLEVWGAAVCCTLLFARFAKVPHFLSWWASLGRVLIVS